MSLISQQDKKLVIRALEFYLDAYDLDPEEKIKFNSLLNWIRLQYNKNVPHK